jgi:A/G-specific adenine glycosylase
MQTLLDSSVQKKFLKKILTWYKKHGRHDMPWRKTKDPYAIFVSEIMLQQTTVATVRPYYDRFLSKFPTLKSLAHADLNDVLALWSGLGYYARARNMWGAMKMIEEKFGGRVPRDPNDLEKLPGVGPYTAGAISSFAYNKPAPIFDGNIIRFFMRILAIEDDPKLKPIQAVLRKTAQDVLDLTKKDKGAKAGPRHLNLAFMDLGSTVCLPQNPKCGECPAADFCLAKQYGKQNDIPLKGEAPERQTIRRFYAPIRFQDKWLVGLRPRDGLFGGLWEFPGIDAPSKIEPVPYLEKRLGEALGFEIRVKEALPAFEHQLSHRIFIVRTFLSEPLRTEDKLEPLISEDLPYQKFQWVGLEKLKKMGISAITSRIIGELNFPKIS